MAARKSSGADAKSGKVRMRSNSSSGMSRTADAVSGDGRIGRLGLVSTSKARISPPWPAAACWWCASARNGDGAGDRLRRIVGVV
jgi:hypothetical protein